jgi:ABC-type Mn2+/Zn2+ transport system permease subunit
MEGRMFTEAFMQRALLAALLLGPVCALLGVFVTARRMAFFSDTIAHGALTGVALGIWLGIADLTLPMVLFSLAMAAGILYLKEKTDLLTDTIMALLLSGSVALGIVIWKFSNGSPAEIHSFLFGDILAVDDRDVWLAAILFAIVMFGMFTWLSPLALITANEELAHVCGIPIRMANYLFVLILTVAVALSIRLLGIILVTSLIVVPPATARNVSRNLRQQLISSVAVGIVGALGGTLFAYKFDVPCGPAIVLSCIALFIISLALGRIRTWRTA